MSNNTMKTIWVLLIGIPTILFIFLWYDWKLLVILFLWQFGDNIAKYRGE